MRIVPLCTLELSFDEPLDLVRTGGGDGAIYGTGSGVVTGEISGRVRWTNHPRVRADGTTLPDLHGVLELDDGTLVMLQMIGVSTLLEDRVSRDTRASATFTAPAGPHAWLNDVFCVCEGAYDTTNENGRFAIHRCVSDSPRRAGVAGHEEIIDAYIAGVRARDADALVPLFRDDAELHMPLFPEPLVGRDRIRSFYEELLGEWTTAVELTIHATAVEGDVGMFEFTFAYDLRGGGRHVAPSVDVFHFEDGLVRRMRAYTDGASLRQALDLS